MDGTQALRLELHRGERVQRFEIHGARALLGSGSHCDVRVRPDEGAYEQIAFELRGSAVIARALTDDPPCRMRGAVFSEQRFESGTAIEIGEIVVRVELIAVQPNAGRSKNRALLPPQLQALGLVGLAVAFYCVLQPKAPRSMLDAAVPAPVLFTDETRDCPAADATAARALAAQMERAADLKRERAPFHAHEGVLAVPLYQQAAACHELARDPEAAHGARQTAELLAARLRDELRVRQVRLERFLARKQYDAAQREISVLRELTRERRDPYAQWLSAVQREIATRFAGRPRRGG